MIDDQVRYPVLVIYIPTNQPVQPLEVREFGLFSTTFRRVDGQEIIAPNSLLASSKLVHNLRRSDSMFVIVLSNS